MRAGLILFAVVYILSQFFRSFLAVMSEALGRDLGARPEDLALASGLWFLAFASMQLPVGWALDRIGPRRTVSVLFGIGAGGGALLFAAATAPWHVSAAMLLIGLGCSPILVGSFFLIARNYPAAMFATLGALVMGVGNLGNLAGSAPLALLVETVGWRGVLVGVAALCVVMAVLLALIVRDPPLAPKDQKGSVLDLIRLRALWLIVPLMFVNYAPSAGLRAVWIGPYLSEVYGASVRTVGMATLLMALAMIAGTFAYGPLDRVFGTRKWVVLGGTAAGFSGCLALWAFPEAGLWISVALLSFVGFMGTAFALLVAHGRSFVPPHLTGRGVTLMNLFGMGGVGVFQVISGRIHVAASAGAAAPVETFTPIFLFFAVVLAIGAVIYLFSQDRLD